jgi:nitrogen-specific signal transduction histidine kinase/ligand-binding sensor protein/ActR/RegA family two-component response regulator
MEFTIKEIFDINALQALMDKFYLASEIPFALIDLSGGIIVGSGWQPICVNFHRTNPLTEKKCIESDISINSRLETGAEYIIFKCPMGLVDCATPLIVEGEKIANLFTGQFLMEKPNVEEWKLKAKKYGFNEEKYLTALSQVPIFDKGKVIKFLEFFTDFSEHLAKMGFANLKQKKMEEEKIKSQKLESLAVLAGGIAHDFNNLLVGIMGNINLLETEDLSEEAKQLLQNLEYAIIKSKKLTNQLLTFTLDAKPFVSVIQITHLIDEIIDFVKHGLNSRIIKHYTEDLPNVEVDSGQFSQLINNILINAQQSMPNGGEINVFTSIAQIQEIPNRIKNQEYIKISIQDHGIGIPIEEQNKIFQPYHTTKKKGSGLGLATSYSIIKRHNGFITFTSKPNKGTIFNIYLPTTNKEIDKISDQKIQDIQFKGKILIMDDEFYIQEILRKIFTRLGFSNDTCSNGKEAINLFKNAFDQKNKYDIVIFDLTIPGSMGGSEAIKIIKKIDPQIISIVSSGYSNDFVMADFKKYGFNAAIPKPYSFNDLKRILIKTVPHLIRKL